MHESRGSARGERGSCSDRDGTGHRQIPLRPGSRWVRRGRGSCGTQSPEQRLNMYPLTRARVNPCRSVRTGVDGYARVCTNVTEEGKSTCMYPLLRVTFGRHSVHTQNTKRLQSQCTNGFTGFTGWVHRVDLWRDIAHAANSVKQASGKGTGQVCFVMDDPLMSTVGDRKDRGGRCGWDGRGRAVRAGRAVRVGRGGAGSAGGWAVRGGQCGRGGAGRGPVSHWVVRALHSCAISPRCVARWE